MDILLKDKVNYEYFAEVNRPIDPLQQIVNSNKSLSSIRKELDSHYNMLSKRYPEYVDYFYKFCYTTPSNGCYSAWFELYGVRE